MPGRLSNKVALVSGASGGIGAEIARHFAAAGAAVIVAYYKSAEAAQDVVDGIARKGGRAVALRADLTDAPQIERLVEGVAANFGKLDILVNNAAIVETGDLAEITTDHVDRLFGLNVRAVLELTRAAVRLFGSEGGRIINISSRSGAYPVAGAAAYCATKAAVNAVTVSLAQELGSRRITVNAIAPGPTDTVSLRRIITLDEERALLDRTPLGRLGRPSDIADVALFLASEESGWINGEVIAATGGLQY